EDILTQNGIKNRAEVIYHKMETNTGGSGGFYAGLELVRTLDVDYVWIMDDDTIPYKTSLEELVKKACKVTDASFFASCVEGPNHEPMNVPDLDRKKTENGYPFWYRNLRDGLVNIESATFVSLLINKKAITKCGLPCRDYFVWGDDTEYTRRLTRYYGAAYLVGDSWVCHKRKNAKNVDLKNENDKQRIKNYYYQYRNRLINYYLYDGFAVFMFYFLRFEGQAFSMFVKGHEKGLKFVTVQKAVFASVRKIKKFGRYIDNQLKGESKC
ncbi:MAG: glycosyltransferase, partial [Tannerellaceae bacterium]|nr:glycosyltransferase [Tannerellaceae bacterium]